MKKLFTLLLAITLTFSLAGCSKKPVDTQIEFSTYEAVKGSLNTSISITGEVKSNKETEMKAPYDLKYGMLTVSVGDFVQEGDQIGLIKEEDVEEMREALLKTYSEEIKKLNDSKETSETISYIAPVEGYVKNIKIKEGESIAAVMEKYGYLAQIVDAKGNVLYNVVGVEGTASLVNDLEGKKVKAGTSILQGTVTKGDAQEQIDKVNELTERVNYLNEHKGEAIPIYATETGVISKINLSEEADVKLGDALLTVVDPQEYYVSSSLSEKNYSKVSIGQTVLVDINALNKTYIGEITYISNSGAGGSFPIKVAIKDAYDMKLGMTANLRIVTNSYSDRLVVPIDAVFTANDGSRYVLLDGETPTDPLTEEDSRAQRVTVGATDGYKIEITSGLEEGDKILMPKMSQYIPKGPTTDGLEPNPNPGEITGGEVVVIEPEIDHTKPVEPPTGPINEEVITE